MAKLHAPLVYYARRDGLIKIGMTRQFKVRMSVLNVEAVLAVEPGEYLLETARHQEFAADRAYDEWFRPSASLMSHVKALRAIHALPPFARRRPRGVYDLSHGERELLGQLPPLLVKVRPGTPERFVRTISVDGESGCWRRSAGVDSTGYGAFWFEGGTRSSHIASHLMFVGPIARGWQVDHVLARGCVFRDCVLPAHLEAVPPDENLRRIPVERRMGTIQGARQRAKTHCPKGHPLSGDNVYWRKGGKPGRQCKTCTKERRRAAYWKDREPAPPRTPKLKVAGPKRLPQKLRTHCPQGHEYTEDNIYWVGPKKNGRQCKTCTRAKARAQHETHRIGDGPVAVPYQLAKTHCPHGHPYSGDNLRIGPAGDRVCIECSRASVRRSRQRKRDREAALLS